MYVILRRIEVAPEEQGTETRSALILVEGEHAEKVTVKGEGGKTDVVPAYPGATRRAAIKAAIASKDVVPEDGPFRAIGARHYGVEEDPKPKVNPALDW